MLGRRKAAQTPAICDEFVSVSMTCECLNIQRQRRGMHANMEDEAGGKQYKN